MTQAAASRLSLTLLSITLLTLTACAAGVAPKETLGAAKMAVEEAEHADAATYAPVELQKARGKLLNAEQAMNDQKFKNAKRFAEQTIVDAKLARARAQEMRATRARLQANDALHDVREDSLRPLR